MAAIQCHHAINLALANFIYEFRDCLHKYHPYKSSVRASRNEQHRPPNNEETTLRGYVRNVFPDPSLKKWITLDHPPYSLSPGGTMSDSSQRENRSSEFRSQPLIVRQWMVTAPFLSLSEYLFLECNRSWGEVKDQVQLPVGEYKEGVLSSLGEYIMNDFRRSIKPVMDLDLEGEMGGCGWPSSNAPYLAWVWPQCLYCRKKKPRSEPRHEPRRLSASFFKYLMNIDDTSRKAFQYGVIRGITKDGWEKETSCPILKLYCDLVDASPGAGDRELLREFEACFKMHDGSGRTLVHILLATDIPTADKTTIWGTLLRTLDWNVLRRYPHGEQKWNIKMADVYVANGWPRLGNYELLWEESSSLSSEMIVLTSPHLDDDMRIIWLENVLLDRDVLPDFSPIAVFTRVLVRTGVVVVDFITSLQYAVLVGNTRTVELLAKYDRMCDSARTNDNCAGSDVSSLHYAAEQGDLEKIRSILKTNKFDPQTYNWKGKTLLQSAVFCQEPSSSLLLLQDYVNIPTMSIHEHSNSSRTKDREGMTKHAGKQPCQCAEHKRETLDIENNRILCVNYLLQVVGLDAWQSDSNKNIPDPGPKASGDYKKWWYDKVMQETQNQKLRLGAAANAMSVTAALVATASYIGPLQPPLGYNLVDEDHIPKMQVDILPVRIFLVCNNLAFFFALTTIMLSLIPSLPTLKESTLQEMTQMRRSVSSALITLIVSVTAILIAFASAIIAVIPNEGNPNRKWISISTLMIGAPMCFRVIAICCIRAGRLYVNSHFTVRRWYARHVFI